MHGAPSVFSSCHRDTSHTGLGPTLAIPFSLNHIFKALISDYRYILRHWDLGLQHMNLGVHNSAHTSTLNNVYLENIGLNLYCISTMVSNLVSAPKYMRYITGLAVRLSNQLQGLLRRMWGAHPSQPQGKVSIGGCGKCKFPRPDLESLFFKDFVRTWPLCQ